MGSAGAGRLLVAENRTSAILIMTLEHIRIGAVLVVAIVAVGSMCARDGSRISDLRRRDPGAAGRDRCRRSVRHHDRCLRAGLLGVALFFPFFALGGMGAGDVKLLAALAAWLGPIDAVYMAIFTAMAGGVDRPRSVGGTRLRPPGPVEYLADVDALAGRRTEAGAGTHVERRPGAAARLCHSHRGRSAVHIMATLTTARRSTERGQAVIELALTLPLLLLVVFGIIDFGFMFQRYESVTNAAREGARLGSCMCVAGLHGHRSAEPRAGLPRASGLNGTTRACGGRDREELDVRADDHVDRAGRGQHAAEDRRSGHGDR